MALFDNIGNFLFPNNGNLSKEEEKKEEKKHQNQYLEMMYMYQRYYGVVETKEYVPQGSILSCQYGTKLSKLDCLEDHGVYSRGYPVMTISDCAVSNIHSFGSCLCPEKNYEGRLPMTVAQDSKGTSAKKAPGNNYAHICVPVINENSVWLQMDSKVLIELKQKGYAPILLESAVLVCQYGGIIRIKEVPSSAKEICEKIEIAPWLFGYRGKPNVLNGRSVKFSSKERQKLNNIKGVKGIDWYSYENRTGPNLYTAPYLENRTFNIGQEGELTDESGRYWITLGPKVILPNYPDNGELVTSEFGDYIGCRVDVVLFDANEDEYVYIECVFSGDIKAHTYSNGIYQTGHPYPNSHSAKAEPYKVEYADGSIIEFTGKQPSSNGKMSNYSVVELFVYQK